MDIMQSIVKRGKLKKIKKMIDIETLLKALAFDLRYAKRYTKELWSVCPHPDHDTTNTSWSININPEDDEHYGRHNCFSCGYKGNFITLTADKLTQSTGKKVTNKQAVEFIVNLFTLDTVDEETIYNLVLEEREQILSGEDESQKGPSESELPEEFELCESGDTYHNYLTKPISEGGRGLKRGLLDKYGIGYCEKGLFRKRIIIPFYQEEILISFLARSILPTIDSKKKEGKEFVICPECKKLNLYGKEECVKCDHDLSNYVVKKARARYPKGSTMELMIWPYDELDPELDYVILVEGAMDKLRLESLGYKNVLCVFGNKISDFQVEMLLKFEKRIGKGLRVFLFPDADEGGNILIEFANQKLKYLFNSWVIELPWQPDNWLDPGNATPTQIRVAVNKSQKLHKVYSRKFG